MWKFCDSIIFLFLKHNSWVCVLPYSHPRKHAKSFFFLLQNDKENALKHKLFLFPSPPNQPHTHFPFHNFLARNRQPYLFFISSPRRHYSIFFSFFYPSCLKARIGNNYFPIKISSSDCSPFAN